MYNNNNNYERGGQIQLGQVLLQVARLGCDGAIIYLLGHYIENQFGTGVGGLGRADWGVRGHCLLGHYIENHFGRGVSRGASNNS